MTLAFDLRSEDRSDDRLLASRLDRVARVDRTSWGEQSETRLVRETATTSFTLLEFRAPAGFGPPRHIHREQDEIFDIRKGTIVVWTPDECQAFGPGDVVVLPHGCPHAWRAYGSSPVHFSITLTPARTAGLEHFFSRIVEQQLAREDIERLTAVADESGIEVVGPPLSDEDVQVILKGGRPA